LVYGKEGELIVLITYQLEPNLMVENGEKIKASIGKIHVVLNQEILLRFT
jgi:hypothetical protein